MAITEDTGFRAQNTGIGGTGSVTYGKTGVSGKFIGIFLTYDSISAIASDPSGYSKVPPRTQTQGSCYFYYKISDGTETAFSLTIPAAVGWQITSTMWNDAMNPVGTDGDNGANSVSATTTPTTGALTPTTYGCLVVALIHHNGTGTSSSITSDGTGGWTHYGIQFQTGSTGYHAYVVQTTAASATYQPTSSLNANYAGKIAAFKQAVKAVPDPMIVQPMPYLIRQRNA
jgi:hypothetical protein